MLARQSTNQDELGSTSINARGAIAAAGRKFGTKAPGTRGGVIEDWRGSAANESGKKKTRRTGLRDGKPEN